MAKGLKPLLDDKDMKVKPATYRGSKDGLIDGWILMMRRHLTKSQSTAAPLDQAWRIIEALEGEARDYLINKLESERNEPEKVFTLLSRRFGSGSNNIQVRRSFAQRDQRPDEDVMQYLDALESLRNQAHPRESSVDRRYEILQRFIEGVRNQNLR